MASHAITMLDYAVPTLRRHIAAAVSYDYFDLMPHYALMALPFTTFTVFTDILCRFYRGLRRHTMLMFATA